MNYISATKEQSIALATIPDEQPMQMLNLLKFKEITETDISGFEQYKLYMKAAAPFFEEANARVLFYGSAELSVIGPSELEWDKVLIVSYPSKKDFFKMATHPDYPTALRDAALEDSRLIFCKSSH